MSKQKVKVVIEKGNYDSNGSVIMIDGLIIPKTGIPVTIEFQSNEVLSNANVFKENGVLMAEFEIDDKFLNAYPAVGVKLLEHHIDENGINVIDKCELFSVGISPIQNADKSIPNLSDGRVS
jgi:hypothetical protein